MLDCPNAEIRDQLPDLLHERLDAERRAAVLAHVIDCPECTAEVKLLRELRDALGVAPRLDLRSIVAALPASPAPGAEVPGVASIETARARKRRRGRWTDWRLAAAAATLMIGGSSLAVLSHQGDATRQVSAIARSGIGASASIPAGASAPAQSPVVASVAGSAPRTATPERRSAGRVSELSVDGGFDGVNDQDLRALLDELDTLDPIPAGDPEPTLPAPSLEQEQL